MPIQLCKKPIVTHAPKEEVKFALKVSELETTTYNGYPLFNGCDHTMVDLSELKFGTDNWMHTLSIKIAEDKYATVCVMKSGSDEDNLDIKVYGEGYNKSRAIGFAPGKHETIEDMNLYTVIAKKVEVEK